MNPPSGVAIRTDGATSVAQSSGELAQRHPGSQRLCIVLTIVISGFLLSLLYHYEIAFCARQPYPLNTFLFRPESQFSDFYNNFPAAKNVYDFLGKQGNVITGMGSAALMVYALLLHFLFYPDATAPGLILTLLLYLGGTLLLLHRTVHRISAESRGLKILILTFCTYPVLFCLDRANAETFIFLALAGAIFSYQKGRTMWAAGLIAVVIAVKPYAIVFLPLFIPDRKFKELFAAGGGAALLSLFCLWILPGPPALIMQYLRQSLTAYTQGYAFGNEGLYFGSSLWGLIKVIIFSMQWPLAASPINVAAYMHRAMTLYFWGAALSFTAIAGLICLVRMRLWQKAALIVCCMNLLPFVCGDYRLMHLFIPLLLFLREEGPVPGNNYFAVLFGLMLIPTSYLHFDFHPAFGVKALEVSDSVVLHPLLMVALVAGVVAVVLRQPEASDFALWLRDLFRWWKPGTAE